MRVTDVGLRLLEWMQLDTNHSPEAQMLANESRYRHFTPFIAMMASFALFAAAASAKPRPARAKALTAGTRLEIPAPDIGPGMSAPERWAFNAAFETAVQRLQEQKTCRYLFRSLYMNGVDALTDTRYEPARRNDDRRICQGGISAITSIGGDTTRLCEHFTTLPQNDKVAILIHEALHAAGLGEAPYHPEAPTSRELTDIVKTACAL